MNARASDHLIDRVLRPPAQLKSNYASVGISLFAIAFCGSIYGAVMGSYAWVAGFKTFSEQLPQIVCSACKVPLLLLLTMLIGLPSFIVVNSLFGFRHQLRDILLAILRAQAALAMILLSLAPFTIFVYVSLPSDEDVYSTAVMFNTLNFLISSLAAQVHLSKSYEPLVEQDKKHLWLKRSWIFIYAFLGIQLGWNLRPFVGSPGSEFSIFRDGGWENAYIYVGQMIQEVIEQLIR